MRDRKLFNEEFRAYRMQAIQDAYPALRDLSWCEIEESYQVNAIYDEIGRRR